MVAGVVNWNMPEDRFEGEPSTVQLDNGKERFVLESTEKLVV